MTMFCFAPDPHVASAFNNLAELYRYAQFKDLLDTYMLASLLLQDIAWRRNVILHGAII